MFQRLSLSPSSGPYIMNAVFSSYIHRQSFCPYRPGPCGERGQSQMVSDVLSEHCLGHNQSTEVMLLVIGSSLWCIQAEHWINFKDMTVLAQERQAAYNAYLVWQATESQLHSSNSHQDMGFFLSSSWYPAVNIKHCNERPKGPVTSNMNSDGQLKPTMGQDITHHLTPLCPFYGMHPVVYLMTRVYQGSVYTTTFWNTVKQNRQYCVNIRFYWRLVATPHVSTLFLGHLQAYKNISISFWIVCLINMNSYCVFSSQVGRAIAQWLDAGFPLRWPGFVYGQHVGFVVDKAALGQVFSEFFVFRCQSFHRFLHYHNHPGLTQ
jgi:hypothetical protein